MSKRFESGAQKRKKQKEIEEFHNKLPKLTNFFVSNQEKKDNDKSGKTLLKIKFLKNFKFSFLEIQKSKFEY